LVLNPSLPIQHLTLFQECLMMLPTFLVLKPEASSLVASPTFSYLSPSPLHSSMNCLSCFQPSKVKTRGNWPTFSLLSFLFGDSL